MLVPPLEKRVILRLVIWVCMMWLPFMARAAPDEPARSVAVIYPDIGEPYRRVFQSIVDGIEERLRARVTTFALSPSESTTDLQAELKRRDIKVVVALGRQGLKAATTLDRGLSMTAAGVLSVPESDAQSLLVHSLAPDPALLFSRLKGLMPAAKRVIVVYDPRQNSWLIRLAREAAKAQGLELIAKEASDLKTAVRLYQDTFAMADPKQDVLWLPQDGTTVDESAVLPLVLKEAWNQNMLVFSSSVTHVKRGVLFSLYPDNRELGRALGAWALAAASSTTPGQRGMIPLHQVLMAINTRTAAHLAIDPANSPHRSSMVFPEP